MARSRRIGTDELKPELMPYNSGGRPRGEQHLGARGVVEGTAPFDGRVRPSTFHYSTDLELSGSIAHNLLYRNTSAT